MVQRYLTDLQNEGTIASISERSRIRRNTGCFRTNKSKLTYLTRKAR